MSDSSQRWMWKLTAGGLLSAALLAVLPSSALSPVRDIVRTALAPLQSGVLTLTESVRARWKNFIADDGSQRNEVAALREQLQEIELRHRQALIAAQQLQATLERVERQGASPFPHRSTAPLFVPQAVEARVLGQALLAEWKAQRWLDRGAADGVTIEQWVLDSHRPVLDAGADQSVFTGMTAFAGRCIAGRIVEAGRQTSALQLVTDPEFRSRAILATVQDDRLQTVVEGLLEGDGSSRCRFTQVPLHVPVRIGDSVYAPPSGLIDAPMLFGRIMRAEKLPGQLHWDIEVQPQIDLEQLRTVQIVVGVPGRERLASRSTAEPL